MTYLTSSPWLERLVRQRVDTLTNGTSSEPVGSGTVTCAYLFLNLFAYLFVFKPVSFDVDVLMIA